MKHKREREKAMRAWRHARKGQGRTEKKAAERE